MTSSNEYIRTVLGDINPKRSGVTLCHEHLSLDYTPFWSPQGGSRQEVAEGIEPKQYHDVTLSPYSNHFNLRLNEESIDAIVEEVGHYKAAGGATIVENTVHGIERDVMKLKEISMRSGLHIVAGTGYYVDQVLSNKTKEMFVEQLCQEMVSEITDGVRDTGIKCGLIGEIGTSWPITTSERKSIIAAAICQNTTGLPVMIHPGRNTDAPFECMRIFMEAGGNASKCAMAHIERTLFDIGDFMEFAKLGSYIEWDHFGMECSYYQNNPAVDMPSDAQRITTISAMVKEGFGKRILLSQDIHTRHRLKKYGGHGYDHILRNVVPKMRTKNISREDIDMILIRNPRTWLTIKN